MGFNDRLGEVALFNYDRDVSEIEYEITCPECGNVTDVSVVIPLADLSYDKVRDMMNSDDFTELCEICEYEFNISAYGHANFSEVDFNGLEEEWVETKKIHSIFENENLVESLQFSNPSRLKLAIFLDSNVFISSQLDFADGSMLMALKKIVEENEIEVYIDEIVKSEVMSNINNNFTKIKERQNISL